MAIDPTALAQSLAADPSTTTYGTLSDVQRRQLMAQQLMTTGSSTAPIQSPWQGFARVLQGVEGGYDAGMLGIEKKAGQAKDPGDLSTMVSELQKGQPAAVVSPTGKALAAGLNGDGGSSLPVFAGGGNGVQAPAALQPIYAQAEAETGVPASVLMAQHAQESQFNPNAVGSAGEIGIGQVKPSTAKDPGYGVAGIDPATLRDPATNIMFSARYLAARAKVSGGGDWSNPSSMAKGLAAYNGGGDPNYVANVARNLPAGGVQVASADPSFAPQATAYAPQASPSPGGAAIDAATDVPLPPPRPAEFGGTGGVLHPDASQGQRYAAALANPDAADPNTRTTYAGAPVAVAPNAAASDTTTGPQVHGTGAPNSDDDDDAPAATATASRGSTALPPVTATAPSATASAARPVLNSRVSPDALKAAMSALSNPYASAASQQVAKMVLTAAFAKDAPISVAKGTVLLDPNTRQPIYSNKDDSDDKQTNDIKNYNFYTQQAKAAGQQPMTFDVWSTAKSRAAASNTTVNVPIDNGKAQNAGQVEAYKLDAEAVRKAQNETVPALDSADENMAIMRAAIDRNGGKLPTGGVLAEMGLNFGRMQSYLRDSYGINVGSADELANLEAFNKGGFRLGGDMAKAIGGNRVLKTEFEQSLKAVPGLETGNAGNLYNLDVLQNANNNKRAYVQAQEDYYRTNKGSLDGFNKSWKGELENNPRVLSNFSVVRPIDAGDGSQFVKLPSTGKGGYTWYRKGQDDPQPIMDPGVVKRLEAQSPMPSQGGRAQSPMAPGVPDPNANSGQKTRNGVGWTVSP